MEVPKGFFSYLWNSLAFIPFFMLLLVLGTIKAALIGPIVFLVITFGNSAVIVGLWPMHAIWSYYCIAKTKKFGTFMKFLLFITLPIPLLLWPLVGFVGSLLTGLGYGFFWPLMATFEAIGEDVPNKIYKCFMDGTWSSVLNGCTIVRDFIDVSFHSYFSVMDLWLESESEKPIEIRVSQIPGCTLAGILGILVDVPIITLIVIYKAPIMLFKGWKRLVGDLIGRSGPFLETVCVPFAGLSILLWPMVVALAALGGIISSFFLGLYAAVVAYQENSTKSGLLYVVAILSFFDEYTNDYIYLQEGSCFPRPRYRKLEGFSVSSILVQRLPEQPEVVHAKPPPVRTASKTIQSLKAMMIWDNFFKGCKHTGTELLEAGAIGLKDLEEWLHSKNKIVSVGIPAYAFLRCFLRSIKSGSSGFLMRDNVELTYVNRPEGRVFDWLFEPMSIMKEQIKGLNLQDTEEKYLYKLSLYWGDMNRVEGWDNGGLPPADEIRSAQLLGISRRLQGFSSMMSRLPMFRRRYAEVVKALVQEAKQRLKERDGGDIAEAAV